MQPNRIVRQGVARQSLGFQQVIQCHQGKLPSSAEPQDEYDLPMSAMSRVRTATRWRQLDDEDEAPCIRWTLGNAKGAESTTARQKLVATHD